MLSMVGQCRLNHRFMRIGCIAAVSLVSTLAGCNFNTAPQAEFTPSPQPVTATSLPEVITPLPSLTAAQIQIETATSTPSPEPPTITPTASDTPGPYQHTIVAGDSLITIVQEYNYTDLTIGQGGIIDQVVVLNGLPSADILPPPGTTIIIPRQTATATPENTLTAAALISTEAAQSPVVTLPANAPVTEYIVQPNDTIVGIAQDNNLTLGQIVVLNPQLDVFSCNFEIPSGGPNCNIPLQVGQVLSLPAPTPTPTLSPTPSGSETATPTPTYSAPMLVSPAEGVVAPPGVFRLEWLSVGILAANEFYLLEVKDVTNEAVFRKVTRDTALILPESLIPNDGQTHTLHWTVSVVTPNEQGVYRTIGGQPEIRTFQWQSRPTGQVKAGDS